MSNATIADELTKTSAFADPYNQPAYGMCVRKETRSGHVIEVFRDAVCRDFIGCVDGMRIGNYESFEHRAWSNASEHVTYLVKQAAHDKAMAEAQAEALATAQEIQAEFEAMERRAGVTDAAPPAKGEPMTSQSEQTKRALRDQLAREQAALRSAATEKEAAYLANRDAARDLALVESAVAVDLAADPNLKNETMRKAALGAWRANEGRQLVEAADHAGDRLRQASQDYDMALEDLKSTRAQMRYETAHLEFKAAELATIPF